MLTPKVVEYGSSAETGSLGMELAFEILEVLAAKAGCDTLRLDEGDRTKERDVQVLQGRKFLGWLVEQDCDDLEEEIVQEFSRRAKEADKVLFATDAQEIGELVHDACSRVTREDAGDWNGFLEGDDSLIFEYEV